MAERDKQHSLTLDNNTLTVRGVVNVVEITEKEAVFKLSGNMFAVKGSGLNVVRLDREQGVVVLEVTHVTSMVYRQGGVSIKGLFR